MDLKNVAHHEGLLIKWQKWTAPFETLWRLKVLGRFFVAPESSHSPVLIYLSSEIGSIASHEHAEKGRLMHWRSADCFIRLYSCTIWRWEKRGRKDVQS